MGGYVSRPTWQGEQTPAANEIQETLAKILNQADQMTANVEAIKKNLDHKSRKERGSDDGYTVPMRNRRNSNMSPSDSDTDSDEECVQLPKDAYKSMKRQIEELQAERDKYRKKYEDQLKVNAPDSSESRGQTVHRMKRLTRSASVEIKHFEEHLSQLKQHEALIPQGISEEGTTPGSNPTSKKAAFRLLRANDEQCQYETPSNGVIYSAPSSQNLVRLMWLNKPRSVLVVKKPKDPRCLQALLDISTWCHDWHNLDVYVEPPVMQELQELADSRSNAMPKLNALVRRSVSATLPMVSPKHNPKKYFQHESKSTDKPEVILNGGTPERAVSIVKTWSEDEQKDLFDIIDFVICIGGDGTILWVSNMFRESVPPVVSFAMGSLGFLTAHPIRQYPTLLNKAMNGVNISLRMRLTATIFKRNKDATDRGSVSDSDEETHTTSCELVALNEVIIDRGGCGSMTNLDCYCDEVFFTKVQADGIIIATPTGSTAYSLSAGGSMVHPEVPAICFTPICPHSLSFRPLTFSDSSTLRISVSRDSRSSVFLSVDGRNKQELSRGDYVEIKMAQYPVPCICHLDETRDWFDAVSHVLQWNSRTKQKPLKGASSYQHSTINRAGPIP